MYVVGGYAILRRAGESTTGYAENAFSLVNRFQVCEGCLRGLVLGASTIYQTGVRAYMYTDAALRRRVCRVGEMSAAAARGRDTAQAGQRRLRHH